MFSKRQRKLSKQGEPDLSGTHSLVKTEWRSPLHSSNMHYDRYRFQPRSSSASQAESLPPRDDSTARRIRTVSPNAARISTHHSSARGCNDAWRTSSEYRVSHLPCHARIDRTLLPTTGAGTVSADRPASLSDLRDGMAARTPPLCRRTRS